MRTIFDRLFAVDDFPTEDRILRDIGCNSDGTPLDQRDPRFRRVARKQPWGFRLFPILLPVLSRMF